MTSDPICLTCRPAGADTLVSLARTALADDAQRLRIAPASRSSKVAWPGFGLSNAIAFPICSTFTLFVDVLLVF